MTPRLLIIFCAALLAAAQLPAAEPAPPAQSYALLIGGLPGPEPYLHRYEDWLGRFKKYLTTSSKLPAANVTVLSSDAATSEAIVSAIGKLGHRIKPRDQFILFIVGHGEVSGPVPTLTLRGPDLSGPQLAAALKGIASKNQIILNFSASSGDFLKYLASPVRVNITANSPSEAEEPIFAEFFLRGLESKRADPDNTITLLSAYNWAAKQTASWIARWRQSGGFEPDSQMWKANGKETVEIFEKLYPNVPTRKLDPSSVRNVEDAEVEMAPPGGDITNAWIDRRVIGEHALLEDCGKEIGVAFFGEKGCQPILGINTQDPGYVAGGVVLGEPQNP